MHDFHSDFSGGPAFEPGMVDAQGRLTRWCKGAKAPQQTSQQKRNERLQEVMLRQQIAAAKKPIEMPHIAMPEPAPPAPPPPMATSSDVLQAERDARRMAQKRTNTGRNTIFAGESALGGPRTLLAA